MKGRLDDKDVLALREACRIAYDVQNELLRDGRLSLAARDRVRDDAAATMRAWEHIPDHFDKP